MAAVTEAVLQSYPGGLGICRARTKDEVGIVEERPASDRVNDCLASAPAGLCGALVARIDCSTEA